MAFQTVPENLHFSIPLCYCLHYNRKMNKLCSLSEKKSDELAIQNFLQTKDD